MRVSAVQELLATYRDEDNVASAIFGKTKGKITVEKVRAGLRNVPSDHSVVLYDLPSGELAIETRLLLQTGQRQSWLPKVAR